MLVTWTKYPCDVFICDSGGSRSERHLKDSFPLQSHTGTQLMGERQGVYLLG